MNFLIYKNNLELKKKDQINCRLNQQNIMFIIEY